MERKNLLVDQLFIETKEMLKLELLTSGVGLQRKITQSELHRPGLALAGFLDFFPYHRVRIQILGNTESQYLKSLSQKERETAVEQVLHDEIPCIFITESNECPKELLEIAEQRKISIIRTEHSTTAFSHILSDYLQHYFAPETDLHATLVDVYGIGLLFTGRSGIGKSEIALDLVERGHRLVADDMVIVTKKGEEILMGAGRDISEHLIEVRGLGLVDVRQMFGIRGVRVQKRIEVVVRLVDFDPDADYDRTGLDEKTENILGVELPLVVLPINPGKNITVIAEAIAMNQQLKIHGHNTPEEFNERLIEKMKQKEKAHLERLKLREFLDKDFE